MLNWGIGRFKPGEGPCWGLLCDFKTSNFAKVPFKLYARSVVRDLDPTNDLTFFRMRSASHEVLVAPDPQFLMIVLQKSCPQQED